jgi:hypothetical protein
MPPSSVPPFDPSPTGDPGLGSQPAAASHGVDYGPSTTSPSLTERPEVLVAGTFVGGLLAATILKRLVR